MVKEVAAEECIDSSRTNIKLKIFHIEVILCIILIYESYLQTLLKLEVISSLLAIGYFGQINLLVQTFF